MRSCEKESPRASPIHTFSSIPVCTRSEGFPRRHWSAQRVSFGGDTPDSGRCDPVRRSRPERLQFTLSRPSLYVPDRKAFPAGIGAHSVYLSEVIPLILGDAIL